MFSKKRLPLVNAINMSILMVFIMTAIITFINTGYDSDFYSRWVNAFLLAWPAAFLIILIMGKRVQKFSASLCTKE